MYLSVIIITTQDRPSDGNSEEWAEDWYMCHHPQAVSWRGPAAAGIYLRMADKQLRLSLSSIFYLAQLAYRSVWG